MPTSVQGDDWTVEHLSEVSFKHKDPRAIYPFNEYEWLIRCM